MSAKTDRHSYEWGWLNCEKHEYLFIHSLPGPWMFICQWCGYVGREPSEFICIDCGEKVHFLETHNHIEICQNQKSDD